MLANNRVSRIEPGFAHLCPKLDTLILTNNRISKLSDIDALAAGCPRVTRLSLLGNLVAKLPSYRSYTVFKFPELKVLDFQKITPKEREDAEATFSKIENLEQIRKTDMQLSIGAAMTNASTQKQQDAGIAGMSPSDQKETDQAAKEQD